MPSALENSIASFRAELLANDAATLQQITASYAEVRARLVKRIGELADAMEREGGPSVSELMQDERARALLRQVEVEMAALGLKSSKPVFDAKEQAVALGSEHAQAMTATVAQNPAIIAQVESSWNRLSTPAAESMVARMSDGSPLQSWFNQFGSDSGSRLAQALRTAAALGTNPRGVARMLEKEVDVSGARLLMMARTEILGAYRDATLHNYLNNADILDGWQWLSAKQTRTCLCCLALDGRTFPLTTTFQPSHVNCRCSSIPVVSGEPPRQRETGAQWFEAQPESVKRQMIPVTAYDDFKAGKLQLHDFIYLDEDEQWGDRYRQGSVAYARSVAKQRGQRFELPTITSVPKTAPTQAERTPTIPASTERPTRSTIKKPPATIAAEATKSTVHIPTTKPLPPMPDEITYEQAFGRPKAEPSPGGSLTTLTGDLSGGERFSLGDYRNVGFNVNKALRSGNERMIDRELVDGLDAVLARSTINEERIVYRGMTGNAFGNLVKAVGKPFSDAGFVSTSSKRSVAEKFASEAESGVVLRIKVPKGAHAFDMQAVTQTSNEGEVLLPRGSAFRVVAVDMQSVPPVVDLEMLP